MSPSSCSAINVSVPLSANDLCSHFYFTRTLDLSPPMGQGHPGSEGRASSQEAGPAEGGHAGADEDRCLEMAVPDLWARTEAGLLPE